MGAANHASDCRYGFLASALLCGHLIKGEMKSKLTPTNRTESIPPVEVARFPTSLELEPMHSTMVQTARGDIIAAIKRCSDVSRATADAVADLSSAPRYPEPDDLLSSHAITNGAVKGAVEAGADLFNFAEGLMRGAVDGAVQNGREPIETIKSTASVAIQTVAALAGDLDGATRGLVSGAVKAAALLAIDADKAAAAVGAGALCGAGHAGSRAVETVLNTMNKAKYRAAFIADSKNIFLDQQHAGVCAT
jgi:hypothetical protein